MQERGSGLINIVCLKWGTLYGPDYVNKLFAGINRNTTVPFKFHCFTDDTTNINPHVETHPLPHDIPGVGWWQKLYLFSAELPIEGKILYVDLDTLITDNIDDILQCDKKFVVLHDFFRIRQPSKRDKFGLGADAVGSGVLMWDAGKYTHIWDTFIADPQSIIENLHPHGDQKHIEQVQGKRSYFQDLFPGQIVSFKIHCRQGLPKHAKIVCYHGKPSIPESINTTTKVQGYTIPPTTWVKKYWNEK